VLFCLNAFCDREQVLCSQSRQKQTRFERTSLRCDSSCHIATSGRLRAVAVPGGFAAVGSRQSANRSELFPPAEVPRYSEEPTSWATFHLACAERYSIIPKLSLYFSLSIKASTKAKESPVSCSFNWTAVFFFFVVGCLT